MRSALRRQPADPAIEEEANWLGPALLVSEEAANHVARMGLPLAKASDVYGVSEDLMRMRLNVTGALIRASRPVASTS